MNDFMNCQLPFLGRKEGGGKYGFLFVTPDWTCPLVQDHKYGIGRDVYDKFPPTLRVKKYREERKKRGVGSQSRTLVGRYR